MFRTTGRLVADLGSCRGRHRRRVGRAGRVGALAGAAAAARCAGAAAAQQQVRRQSFTGSTPLYRLKPRADATAWLFTASASERNSLLGQGWVDERVSGYRATASGPGLVRLMRFNNSSE